MPQTLWSSFCVPTVKMPLFSPGSVYILEINKQKCPEWDEKMRLHIKILISPFELSPSGFLSVPWWLLFSTKLVSVPPPPSSPSILISLCFLKAELCFSSEGQGPIVRHSCFGDKSQATPCPLPSYCRATCFLQSCCIIVTPTSVQYSVMWLEHGLYLK